MEWEDSRADIPWSETLLTVQLPEVSDITCWSFKDRFLHLALDSGWLPMELPSFPMVATRSALLCHHRLFSKGILYPKFKCSQYKIIYKT